MVFKRFRVNIILRILLLVISLLLVVYTLGSRSMVIPFLLVVACIYQVWSLITYVERTNRELATFLESVRYSEFNRKFRLEESGPSFAELGDAFNNVMEEFQKVRSEREEHFHYLQNIVQSIDVSILAYQRDGTVEMINPAAKKLFQVNNLRSIHELRGLSEQLANTLQAIQPGENKLVKVQDEEDLLQLAIHASEFKLKDKSILLTTVKNIQSVLEEQETDAWQRLIRVLTHEIMNSIAPISSLSSTIDKMVEPFAGSEERISEITTDDVEEIRTALQTINKRSSGLMDFVETYRSLTRVPEPNFGELRMRDLLKDVVTLMNTEVALEGFSLSYSQEPESIQLHVDEQMIQQVLINLIKNSLQGLQGNSGGEIRLRGFYNKRGRPCIQVSDNGKGILPDVIDKVFIPFFTTRQRGSGIGLSLSRQILRLHGGSITAQSEPGKETIFTLTF